MSGGYDFAKLKVMVVDDNEHMRLLLGTILKAFGVTRVFELMSAEDAWLRMIDTPCDIIIVDWVMEGMSGLEFVKKLRNAPDSPNPFVPIIMLTGHTSLERVRQARDAGVNEFLAKPVSSKMLMSRVIAVIENPRSFVRTRSYFGPCRRRRRDEKYEGPERRTGDPGKAKADGKEAA
jgi:two-component system, chemotaxis family, chemotaxis protein CheY